MGVVKEFKEFALRGNALDLAIGVFLGVAFQKIVNSLVIDVLTPPIGYFVKGIKFSDLKIPLPQVSLGEKVPEPVTINIGNFLQATFDFTIAAICIFGFVKIMNNLRRKLGDDKPAVKPEPPADVKLLIEIRDLLKAT